MEYKIGDIVWVSEAIKTQERGSVKNHLFVIIGDDGKSVPIEYFGFVISSRLDKSKENSIYKYNETIMKDNENNLTTNSIVKCDQLLSIPEDNINRRIGSVNAEDLIRFLNAFEEFLQEN